MIRRGAWASSEVYKRKLRCQFVGGLAHDEAEEISLDWARAGTDVLFHAVVETAEIVG